MSAGRQSPPIETQSGAQGADPLSSGRVDSKFAPPPEYAPKTAEAERRGSTPGTSHRAGLESNPKHVLEDIEAGKYHKGVIESTRNEAVS
ncbi:hypothetical protein BJX76DRAFT_362962 [Aspergillus varians]